MPVRIFTCSHITFGMVYSFYFLCFGSRRTEFNSFWERDKEMGQKVVAYSDAISTMLNLLSSFTDDNMIPKPITVHDDFIIILSQYITFLKTYTIRYNKGDSFTFFGK